ncbi:hypothetical protein BC936DRAFT_144366 [Jimgerdemannia flammicorona]|uniref:Replication factor A C-terminal domain-containing protein n=1 Tax=Jimgerdemannia flammicorona TaxID=994334 RepID=A0A433DM54_9FUNG|nr:hypothetical protein BC936DRAFT_144366 [Jimgerdemannia flammicorona]
MVRVLATVVRIAPLATFCYPSCSDCLASLNSALSCKKCLRLHKPQDVMYRYRVSLVISINAVARLLKGPLTELFGLPATEFQEHLNLICRTSPTLHTQKNLQQHVWDALECIMIGELYGFDLDAAWETAGHKVIPQESIVAKITPLQSPMVTVVDYLKRYTCVWEVKLSTQPCIANVDENRILEKSTAETHDNAVPENLGPDLLPSDFVAPVNPYPKDKGHASADSDDEYNKLQLSDFPDDDELLFETVSYTASRDSKKCC